MMMKAMKTTRKRRKRRTRKKTKNHRLLNPLKVKKIGKEMTTMMMAVCPMTVMTAAEAMIDIAILSPLL
jgi:hypothetical protein